MRKNTIVIILLIILFIMPMTVVTGQVIDEFESIFHNHGSMMLFIDQQTGEIIYANHAAADFYGYSIQQLENMNINDLNVLSPEEIKEVMAQAVQKEQNFFRFKHRTANGEIKNIEVYSYPQTINGRDVLFSIFNDVTHEVALEEQNAASRRAFYMSLIIIIALLLFGTYFLYRDNQKIKKSKQKMENFNKLRQTFIDADDSLIYLKDENLNYVFVNQATADFYNCTKEKLIGQNDYEITGEAFADLRRATDKSVQDQHQLITEEVHWDDHIYKSIKFPVELINGNYGVGAYIKDITDEYENKRQLIIERNKYKQTLISIGDGVIIINLDNTIEMINKVAQELTGWSRAHAIGQHYKKVLHLVDEEHHYIEKDIVQKALEEQNIQTLNKKTILIDRNGNEYYIDDSVAPIRDDHGHVIGVVIVFRDDTANQQQKDRIEFLSYHDELTGIYNRRYFEEELKRLDTKRQLPLSLIMTDVNGLKLVNDTYGHEQGDHLLVKTAELLNDVLREEDIVARFGGDEFSIILPQTTADETIKIIQRIRDRTSQTEVNEIPISLGIGFAIKEDPEQEIRTIFNIADDKMYKDKLTKSRSAKNKLVSNLLNTLGAKSNETKNHAIRMTELAIKLGEKIGLKDEDLNNISLLATLHDIGKVTISENILRKPGTLTADEWEIVKEHPQKGFTIASASDDFSVIAKYILHHHERWDGSGYPEKLKGEEIPLLSRIIAIVDSFDVMMNDRPYKKAMTTDEAVEELKRCAGSQFDPKLTKEFLELVQQDEFSIA